MGPNGKVLSHSFAGSLSLAGCSLRSVPWGPIPTGESVGLVVEGRLRAARMTRALERHVRWMLNLWPQFLGAGIVETHW